MRKWIFHILLFVSSVTLAQDTVPYDLKIRVDSTPVSNTQRTWLVGTASAICYGGSFLFLNEAWYKEYPRSSFHTFNDAGEWQQMDKIGHAWTAYHTSRLNTGLWKWAGVDENKSVLIGSSTSLLYLLGIEYLDGRSAQWGWSWPDAGADISGVALFASQQLLWKEQRIGIKFSSYHKNYGPSSLKQRADVLFGQPLPERLLKDYNAQTYWLTFNVKSLLKTGKLPGWLNIAFGYGAEGMFGGYENIGRDKEGNVIFDRRDIKRYRQWYLSPDIDLTKIKTKSPFLRTAFFLLNAIKIPAPTLELSNGKLKGHWLAF